MMARIALTVVELNNAAAVRLFTNKWTCRRCEYAYLNVILSSIISSRSTYEHCYNMPTQSIESPTVWSTFK